ncbi:MAG TPA: hypothetical protein DCW90_09505 [Lachnospiraceae bacterium]|nr:hypothetical protein [Lachnospiraceae bacterium]
MKNGEIQKFMIDSKYQEIFKLKNMLHDAGIPYVFQSSYDGFQIGVPTLDKEDIICDAIEHCYSYGCEKDLLEMMGLIPEYVDDAVEGYLTAETVFERIKNYYNSKE